MYGLLLASEQKLATYIHFSCKWWLLLQKRLVFSGSLQAWQVTFWQIIPTVHFLPKLLINSKKKWLKEHCKSLKGSQQSHFIFIDCLRPGISVKCFLKRTCHQRKLRQTKCLLFNFWNCHVSNVFFRYNCKLYH